MAFERLKTERGKNMLSFNGYKFEKEKEVGEVGNVKSI